MKHQPGLLLILVLALARCGGEPVVTQPLWSFTPGSSGVLAPPFVVDALLVVPFVDTSIDPPVARVYVLDRSSGLLRWEAVLEHELKTGESFMPPIAAAAGSLVYHGTHAIHALDLQRGSERWSYANAVVLLQASEDRVALIGPGATLIVLDAVSGARRVTTALGVGERYGYTSQAKLFFAYDTIRLTATDIMTGRRLWSFSATEPMQPPVLACDDLIIFQDSRGTHSLDRSSGKERWSLPLEVGVDACHGSLVYDEVQDGVREVVRVYDTLEGRELRVITHQAMRTELGLPEPAPDPGGVLTPEGVRVRIEQTRQSEVPWRERLTGATQARVLESRLTATDGQSGAWRWSSARLRAQLTQPLVSEGLLIVAANPTDEGSPAVLAFRVAH